MKSISILGSTGSVGVSSLDLIDKNPHQFKVLALAGGHNIDLLSQQCLKYKPLLVSCLEESDCKTLKQRCSDLKHTEFMSGEDGACAVASMNQADYVISAIVGAAGLKPTIAAIKSNKTVALANKESLVVAGAYVNEVLKQHPKSKLLPVDSEHSAIFQCLENKEDLSYKNIRRIILTASGGPFFLQKNKDLNTVTLEEALKHPNWSMGNKITIDSATMMNKGLEAIEAYWLFNVPAEKLDIVIHPQSIVHSMVEYMDGSILAQLSKPDMKGPIAYALSYPDRIEQAVEYLDFSKLSKLEFFAPDTKRFPATELAMNSLKAGPDYPAVLNGANEVSVDAFLKQKITFTQITEINETVLNCYNGQKAVSLDDFLQADAWGRQTAQACINRM
ncbi:MAG TPA: 1-deoxy-D-xylulose-5-phosphate reductoisomerase [Oligoflexia bacterium]|nr:1-deoxy-D-xylulose-5-phosphate reductoisomerase [Oligoflexia bacterium]HMR24956.1 1-deoxy-D-xylulose-5-phosphate reductoisomerase [Oligoflexia bacterium]